MEIPARLLLICAHRWEAEPFLRLAELKPVPHSPVKLFCDQTGEIWLLICGQGPMRASTCTAVALTSLAEGSESLVVANFGFAAAEAERHELQSTVLANKVTDQNSGDNIYPERTLRSPWNEAEIVTVGKPISAPVAEISQAVYDMEAAAILSASELFLSTSQMIVGKFVSDHLDGSIPNWAELRDQHAKAYEGACEEFLRFTMAQQELLRSEPRRKAASAAEEWASLQAERISSKLGLSVTQTRQVKQTLRALALSNSPNGSLQAVEDEILYLLDEFGETEQKHDRQRALEKVQQLALAPLEFES